VPTNNTIRHELTYLKIFIHWSQSVGHTSKEVTIEKPPKGNNRRPHFTRGDWSKLTRFMRIWISRGEEDGGKTRERLMLCQCMLVLTNTGIRIGEARMLKWRDIESKERLVNDKKSQRYIFLGEGKDKR